MRCVFCTLLLLSSAAHGYDPIEIGSRCELLVDQHLIEQMDGVQLTLHRPVRREVVFRSDAAWEGNGSAYQSVFQDGDRIRLYCLPGHLSAPKMLPPDDRTVSSLPNPFRNHTLRKTAGLSL